MGDGRYYTWDQLINIIFWTAFIICLVIVLMLNIYKNERYKTYMVALGGCLSIGLVSAFSREVAYHFIIFEGSKILYLVSFGAYVLTQWMLMRNIASVSRLVRVAMGTFLLVCWFAIWQMGSMVVLAVPFLAQYVWISYKLVTYQVSAGVFTAVKHHMLDYVFIVSMTGEVMFTNDNVTRSGLFKVVDRVDWTDISSLFVSSTIVRQAFSKKLIRIECNPVVYVQYHRKAIYQKGNVVGYIMTFVDISELITMLDRLDEKRKQARTVNQQLEKNKEIVYEVEKEKEIEHLLAMVAHDQQKAMIMIQNRLRKIDITDGDFIQMVDQISAETKKELAEVRAVVTSYSQYYL